MVWEGQDERRWTSGPVSAEGCGALWSLPAGRCLPNALENTVLVMGDPDHPARLRSTDLENPAGFHLRLTTWLLRQG